MVLWPCDSNIGKDYQLQTGKRFTFSKGPQLFGIIKKVETEVSTYINGTIIIGMIKYSAVNF
jgi:hypothetical protein